MHAIPPILRSFREQSLVQDVLGCRLELLRQDLRRVAFLLDS
jgi:hypothetical protein